MERFVALWQEVEIARSWEGRGGISITLKHRVCLLEWFSAGKGGKGSWRGKERGPVSAWSKTMVVALSMRGEEESCFSLSFSLDFVCYLLSEPLLTACLSSKESEFILVLPRFCSRFYSPGFFLPFFRLSFLRRNLEMRLLRNLERWKQLDSGGFCEKCLYFLWKFIKFTCFFTRERNLFNCFICFFI